MRDELENVKFLAGQLKRICQERWPHEQQHTVNEAKHILDDVVETRLRSLEGYLDKHDTRNSKIFLHQISWARLCNKINVERNALRGAIERLFNIFHLLNGSTTRQLSFRATELSTSMEVIQKTQDRSHEEIVVQLQQYMGPLDNR